MTIDPPPAGTTFSRDPVLITTALFTAADGVIAVLLMAGVLSALAGGIAAGVTTVAWAAVNVLLVKPATVPRQPLETLAWHETHPDE